MAMVSFTSAGSTKLSSQTISFENNNNHLRDVSFSSYLSSAEEAFVRKLVDSSNRNTSPIVINTQEEQQLSLGRKKEEDGEIGVFGAEKYFNGRMDEETPKIGNTVVAEQQQQQQKQYKKDEPAAITEPTKPRVHPGTPSIRSESSWNSQSALLQSVVRNPSQRKTKKVHRKSFLGSLSCKCACSDKNSVDIDDHAGEISFSRSARYGVVQAKPIITKDPIKNSPEVCVQKMDKMGSGLDKESCFVFQNPNPGDSDPPVKMQFQLEDDQKERKSMEVFGSPILEKRNKSLNLESRLAKLGCEANPRLLEEIEFGPNGIIYSNDSESDASSDLFEIDSLTGKANPFLARQASDIASGCVTPTTCYAPSEASIEWSVVTASAADFSVMSDCEEQRPTTVASPINTFSPAGSSKTRSSKESIQRRRPNILSGCKSYKSVRVAGDAYVANEKVLHSDHHHPRTRRGFDPITPVTRFQAENKLTGFDSRHGQQHGLAKHQLPRSHSPRASHLLYIQ